MQHRLFVHVAIACVCVLLTIPSRAQYYFYNDRYYSGDLVLEAGGSVGVMNSLTDLGGKKGPGKGFIKDLNLKMTKPSFSIYTILMYKEAIGFRLEATFGRVGSYDSILKSSPQEPRYLRNLSFRSRITDIQLAAEIHPLFFKLYEENEAPYISPYLVAGIGFFSFNPQANLNGRWYDLQPLHLEGQGFTEYSNHKSYSLHQFNIPVGMGVKFEATSSVNIRLEFVHRFLFTDYLDDVSDTYIDPALFSKYLLPSHASVAQKLYSRRNEIDPTYNVSPGEIRGDPKNKDAFFSFQLKIGMAIRSKRVD